MKVELANRVGTVKEYYFSTKLREIADMRAQGLDVLNLGIGSPNLPPSNTVIEKLIESAKAPGNHAYQSYKGIDELRSAWATFYKRYYDVALDPSMEVLPLIGSKEGIMHIAMTYLQEGDKVLVPNPGYPTYAAASNLAGAEVLFYDLKAENGWMPDLEALTENDLSSVKIMWINYPHMPSGTAANIEVFENLIAFAKQHNILLCHDNPYSFIQTKKPTSILSVAGAKEVCIELNSLSKTFNMAGWRVGVATGRQERISEILRFKSNMDSGTFRPVQLAAAAALLQDNEWIDNNNAVYADRKKKAYELLDVLQCTYTIDQVGMFVWAQTPNKRDDKLFIDEILQAANVFITPGSIFGSNGVGFVRVSLCATLEMYNEAIERCAKIKDEVL